MGTFSKLHRYHGAGEAPNISNVDRFGEPARSLFTSAKVFSLRHRIDITDGQENPVYASERARVFSLHDKTNVFDAAGRQVAHIERKLFTLHERHFVTMADGTAFELSNELFHLIRDITNIVGLGWQLRGNILGLNFELYDETGKIIAVISQKMLSLHDRYCIDIYQPEHEATAVAILVALQHMIRDRQAAASSGSSSSSSSGS